MNLVDTHFHLREDDDPVALAESAAAAGVDGLVAVGGNLAESRRSATFAESRANAWFMAGLHPHEAAAFDGVGEFAKFAGNPKLVAIGEIGLDFYYGFSERPRQLEALDAFLELAVSLDLPVCLHCRDRDGADDAYGETYARIERFVQQHRGRFVLHCFTGGLAWAEKFLALGGYFGVAGIVTFPKGGNVRDTVAALPLERLLLETDSPYLAPKPHRGKPNQPAFLPLVAAAVAEVKGATAAEIAAATSANAARLFGF